MIKNTVLLEQRIRILLVLSLVLLILQTGFEGITAIRLNTNLQAGDQGAYLSLSLAQAEGLRLTDGNRHPLYPALLVPFAERSVRFFSRARWVSFVLGMALIVSAAGLEWKNRNDLWSAVVALSFLSAHVQMIRTISEIWCEPLLYLLVYFLWWKADHSPSRNTQIEDRAGKKKLIHYLCMGVLSGAVYLTKGTGLEVAFLFWVTIILFSKEKKKAGMGILVFFLVASPLFVWNTIRYANPVYNFASTHNMWFDEADEIWYDDPATLPTLGSYIQSHSPGQIGGRILRGVVLETKMAIQLFGSDWQWPLLPSHSWLRIWFFLFKCFVYAAVAGGFFIRWRERKENLTSRAGLTFLGLMAVAFWVGFGWYAQLTNEPRFLMTLVPVGVVLGARAASLFVRALSDVRIFCGNERRWFFSPRGVLAIFFFLHALTGFCHSTSLVWKSRSLPPPSLTPLQERVLTQLDKLPENSRIAFGPSHGLPLWLTRTDLVWRPTPWNVDWNRFLRMLEREQIEYVMVDNETLARRPYLVRLLNPSAVLQLGWKMIFMEHGNGDRVVLFQVKHSADSPQQAPRKENPKKAEGS